MDLRGCGKAIIVRLSRYCASTWIPTVRTIISRPCEARMSEVSIVMSDCLPALLRFAQQMVRDDALLDLAGALEDLGQPRIAPVALDGVERRVARAAEHLQRLGGHALGHLRGMELHHRRLLVAAELAVDFVAYVVHELARGLDFGRHPRQPKACVLEVADRLAELPPLLRIGRRILERAAGESDRTRRSVGPRPLEAGGDVVEGAAL